MRFFFLKTATCFEPRRLRFWLTIINYPQVYISIHSRAKNITRSTLSRRSHISEAPIFLLYIVVYKKKENATTQIIINHNPLRVTTLSCSKRIIKTCNKFSSLVCVGRSHKHLLMYTSIKQDLHSIFIRAKTPALFTPIGVIYLPM